jgi:hypothetical protein
VTTGKIIYNSFLAILIQTAKFIILVTTRCANKSYCTKTTRYWLIKIDFIAYSVIISFLYGEVAERPNAAVLKTVEG